jgi:cation diffusion facilitator family transporter
MGAAVIDEVRGWSMLPEAVGKARRSAWNALGHTFQRFSTTELGRMKAPTRQYYANLYSLIDKLESADMHDDANDSTISPTLGKASTLIYGSFLANLAIFVVKVIVAMSSGALVVYASALDSFLDLLSGSILSITAWIMAKPSPYKYPLGKDRMEPLGVIVFAAIMGTCYMQVIVEAVQRVIKPDEVVCSAAVIALLLSIVLTKSFLYCACRAALNTLKAPSSALEAQAEDHFNDCLTNTLSAIGAFLASSFFSTKVLGFENPLALYWIDPFVATLFSSYVIVCWANVARENIVALVGQAAPPQLMQRITYLAACHCSEVIAVDTVRAYSFGAKYMAEVDIVLPPDMPNQQAHDIGESLQIRIESLEEIDRCFVHIDWETTHKPEHRQA